MTDIIGWNLLEAEESGAGVKVQLIYEANISGNIGTEKLGWALVLKLYSLSESPRDVCVCVCVCVCMCVHECMGVCMCAGWCVHTSVCMPEVSVRSLPQSVRTLLFETSLLPEPGGWLARELQQNACLHLQASPFTLVFM